MEKKIKLTNGLIISEPKSQEGNINGVLFEEKDTAGNITARTCFNYSDVYKALEYFYFLKSNDIKHEIINPEGKEENETDYYL